MRSTDIETVLHHPEQIEEAKKPRKGWEFIGVDSKNYAVDMGIYKDKKSGKLYMVDIDSEWGF